MALVFPRELPCQVPQVETFEIQRVDYLSPSADGRLGAISAGYPLWAAEWTLPTSDREAADEWRAWISAQRGPGRLFYGREMNRPFPAAYLKTGFTGMVRAGGGAFDGTATSWSVSGTRDVLTLNGLPAGFAFRWGDYVNFKWTTGGQQRRSLVRSVDAPQTANGSGQLVVTIEPPLPLLTSVSAVANLEKPDCLMKLIPSETEFGGKSIGQAISGRIKALQQLEP